MYELSYIVPRRSGETMTFPAFLLSCALALGLPVPAQTRPVQVAVAVRPEGDEG